MINHIDRAIIKYADLVAPISYEVIRRDAEILAKEDGKKVLRKISGKRPGKKCGNSYVSADKKCKEHNTKAESGRRKLTEAGKKSAEELATKIRARKRMTTKRKNPKDLFDDDLLRKVESAYSHSASRAAGAAKLEKQYFEGFLDNVEELVRKSPTPPKDVNSVLDGAAKEYLSRRNGVFSARASTYSSLIAGRSKFNSRQAGKRSSTLDNREADFSKWQKSFVKSLEDKYGITAQKEESSRKKAELEARAKQSIKEEEKAKKKESAKLPISNKKEGAYPITSAEWAKKGKDYKSIEVSKDGKSRERWMMLPMSAGGGLGRVYLTDKKES